MSTVFAQHNCVFILFISSSSCHGTWERMRLPVYNKAVKNLKVIWAVPMPLAPRWLCFSPFSTSWLADIVFTRCFDLSVPSSVPETLEIKLAFTKLGIRTVILTGEKARGCKPHVRSVCLSYQTSVLVTHPSSNLASPKFVLFFAAGWGSSIYTLCVKPLGVLQAHRIRVRP